MFNKLLNMDYKDIYFVTIDNKSYKISGEFYQFFNVLQKENKITTLNEFRVINLSFHSVILNLIMNFCFNFINSKPQNVSRPLKIIPFENIVKNEFISLFFSKLEFEILISLISSCEELECEFMLQYCLIKLAVMIRESSINDLKSVLNLNTFDEKDKKIFEEINLQNVMKITMERLIELEETED